MRSPKHSKDKTALRENAGMSHREITVATNTSLGTVKTRLELGLQKLTQAIRPLWNKI